MTQSSVAGLYAELAPDALAELYAEHAPAARRAALGLVRPDDADDVVSESFTRILGAVRSGRAAPERFRPYLMATVRHEAARTHRDGARLTVVADPDPPAAGAADEPVLDADEASRVREAYATLPPRWQAVLRATEVDGRSARELAEEFGTTPDGVAQLAARARDRLRRAYLAAHAPCKPHADALAARARGQLGPRRSRTLDAHLAGCGRCRSASGDLAAINSRLGVIIGPVTALALAATAKAARRGLSWAHPAAWTAAAASLVVAGGVLPLTLATPPHGGGAVRGAGHAATGPVQARPAAAQVQAQVPYQARHARPPAPVPSTAGQVVTGVTQAAGQAVTSTGQAAGTAVTGVASAAGQAVTPLSPAIGQAVAGTGSAAGAAVSGITSTAGQLGGTVGGVVSSLGL
jgi:RNA polymerase sigma factor (sigma-70 family)